MNVTDVGHLTSDADTGKDRMEKGSRRTGRSAWEIAQTQACDGARLANFWMHGYFLQIARARMGKSEGNFLRASSVWTRTPGAN